MRAGPSRLSSILLRSWPCRGTCDKCRSNPIWPASKWSRKLWTACAIPAAHLAGNAEGRVKPTPAQLRRVVEELNRHVGETASPLDCVQTECFRSDGAVDNTNLWSFAAQGSPNRLPERRLIGGIAFSLEMPWEEQRKLRIWQLVWAGLFRAVKTPYWELPETSELPPMAKPATKKVLHGWLPAKEGAVLR